MPSYEKGTSMGFFEGFRRGMEDNWTYEVAGRQVVCPHCGCNEFEKSDAQLNTAFLTFLDFDWANRSAAVLICRNCGHIEWFLDTNGELS